MATPSREIVLGNIRKALRDNPAPMPFPEVEKKEGIYVREDIGVEEKFASEFAKLGGKFIYCGSEKELIQQLEALQDTMKWPHIHVRDQFLLQLFAPHQLDFIRPGQDMQDIEVGMSLCECLVARTGSVLLSSSGEYGRALPVYAPIHITIAFMHQVVWDVEDSIRLMQEKYPTGLPSMLSLTTGPSRTADIEKTLVVGVHGPKEVYVFLLDSNWKQEEAD